MTIGDSDMVGWWLEEAPVTVIGGGDPWRGDAHAVLATSYVIPGNRTLVALASWAASTVTVRLQIDWVAPGLDPREVTSMTAPPIASFQRGGSWAVGEALPVKPAEGLLLVLAAPGS